MWIVKILSLLDSAQHSPQSVILHATREFESVIYEPFIVGRRFLPNIIQWMMFGKKRPPIQGVIRLTVHMYRHSRRLKQTGLSLTAHSVSSFKRTLRNGYDFLSHRPRCVDGPLAFPIWLQNAQPNFDIMNPIEVGDFAWYEIIFDLGVIMVLFVIVFRFRTCTTCQTTSCTSPFSKRYYRIW